MRTTARKMTCETQGQLAAELRRYEAASLASTTVELYERRFRDFSNWCQRHRRGHLPAAAESVALFMTDIADRYRPSTVETYLTAIAHAHRAAGLTFDRSVYQVVLEGIHRTFGMPRREPEPLTITELRVVVGVLADDLSGARDRALLTLGFAGALRPSELVGLDVGRPTSRSAGVVEIAPEGVRLTVRRPQVDQPPIVKAIPRGGDPCPVEALERWLERAEIVRGAVFRALTLEGTITARRVRTEFVRRRVKHAIFRSSRQRGMSTTAARNRAEQFTGYSLRCGFIASALAAGASSESIARHVGWMSTKMIASYRRKSSSFKQHPLSRVLSSS